MIVIKILVSMVGLALVVTAQQQDPFSVNGGSILAMAGKNSVAIAVDKRFGSGPQMVTISPRHVWIPRPNLMVAFVGLDGDVQSLAETLQMQVNSKLNRVLGFEVTGNEGRDRNSRISPQSLASLTSHVLYQNRGRFYVEPLIVGLKERTGVPYLCGMDSIGAQSLSNTFACSGAASKSLYGTAEALWRPDLEADELVEVCGKAFQSALERDCLSGYGALVYLITKDGVVEFDLASRND